MIAAAHKPFELSVLPKGLHGDKLTLTLVFAPNAAALHWREHNLPELLLRAGKLRFQMHGARGALAKAPWINPPAELRTLLQPKLWQDLFAGVPEQPAVSISAEAPPPQILYYSTASAGLALTRFTSDSAVKANKALRAYSARGRHIRVTAPALSLLTEPTDKGLADDRLNNDYRDVQERFLRSGQSLQEVAHALKPLSARLAANSPLLAQLSGYTPEVARSDLRVERTMRRLGLTESGFDGLARSFTRLRLKAEHQITPNRAGATLFDAWALATVATAPYVPKGRFAGLSATAVHDHEDLISLENRLAAIAQEFASQPYLGLAVDMEVAVDSLGVPAHVAQALASGMGFVSAEWDGMASWVETARTAIGPDGFARTRKLDPSLFTAGRLNVSEARISNIEIHGNLEKTLAGMLQTIAHADATVRGAGALGAKQEISALRSGPMRLHHPSYRSTFDTVTSTEPADTDKYLEELVIGVRPDLRVSSAGRPAVWRAMMDREIVYPDIPLAARELAEKVTSPTRREGFVPLSRRSETGSFEGPTVTITDSMFEWNGWNPAVSFPTRKRQEADPPLLVRKVSAVRGANPRFRYGAAVEVSVRIVLRDGWSVGKDQPPGPAFATTTGLQGATEDPFRLLRYEPLRAPAALLTEEVIQSSLREVQSATRVVLAQPQWGCSLGCFRSSRYLLAGELHDLVELDKHGAFDLGAKPSDSAFGYFERDAKGAFPAVEGGPGPQPVARPRSGQLPSPVPYHPDPLVKRLRLVLVRQSSHGDLVCLDGPKESIEYVHELYAHGVGWPFARPLRIDFIAAQPASAAPGMRRLAALPHENAIEIVVPTGENFDLLAFPEGDEGATKLQQFASSMNLPKDSPFVCEMLQIHVQNLARAPRPPRLDRIEAPDRAPGEHVGLLKVHAHVDAGATAVLELVAAWSDPDDNPAMGLLTHGSLPPARRSGEMVVADLSEAVRTQVDEKIRDGQQIERGFVEVEFLHVLHDLRDDHHRPVHYFLRAQAAATLGKRRDAPVTSNQLRVQWLATRCPPSLKFLNAAPAFRFRRTRELGMTVSVRDQGLCIFLGRDWGASGPDELFGIVCAPGDNVQGAVSEWGTDPTRLTGRLARRHMRTTDFLPSASSLTTVHAKAMESTGLLLYQPTYDVDEDAWRVDLRLNAALPPVEVRGQQLRLDVAVDATIPTDVAQPMLRLVAVRHQPNALPGLWSSERVLLDYVQMPSQRAATAFMDEGGEKLLVTVYGPMGQGSVDGGEPALQCSLLEGEVAGRGALVWRETGISARLLAQHADSQPAGNRHAVRWTAELPIPVGVRRQRVGMRIVERTQYLSGKTGPEHSLGPVLYQELVELRLVDSPDPGGKN